MENTFCKVLPDIAGKDKYCMVCSADGVGTKAHHILGDVTYDLVLGIVHDAVVMNLDDLLCVGATKNFYMTNTISISPKIDKKVVDYIYRAIEEVCGIYKIQNGGGETAILNTIDTLLFDVSMFTRMKRKKLIYVTLDDCVASDEIACVGIKLSETSWGCNGFTELSKLRGVDFDDLETTYSIQ